MAISAKLPVAIIGTVIAVLLSALGLIQLGSVSLYGGRVPESLGLAIYHALDRVAPAPYVEETLARTALAHHDINSAEYYAVRLPATPARSELLAQAAQARGNHLLALEYYFAAPDVDAVQTEISAMAMHDPRGAYAFEERFRDRLTTLTTHPDAVADSYWISGLIAARNGWNDRALDNYRAAAERAPLSAKYALAAANQALTMRSYNIATHWYTEGLNIDPQSADATAGLGLVALRQGDRGSAIRYAERARTIDPNAALLTELERELK